MSIEFACECGQRMTARDDRAGEAVACPKCGAGLAVPGVAPSAGGVGTTPRVNFWWNFYGGLLILVLVVTALGLVGSMFAPPGPRDPIAGLTLAVCFTIALAGLACSTPRLRD